MTKEKYLKEVYVKMEVRGHTTHWFFSCRERLAPLLPGNGGRRGLRGGEERWREGRGMELDDGWEPSAEELDFLERDAIRKINERKASSAAASTSWPSSPSPAAGASPSASPLAPPQHDHSRGGLFPVLGDSGRSPARVSLGARYEQSSPLKAVGQCPITTDRIHQRNTVRAMDLSLDLWATCAAFVLSCGYILANMRGEGGISRDQILGF